MRLERVLDRCQEGLGWIKESDELSDSRRRPLVWPSGRVTLSSGPCEKSVGERAVGMSVGMEFGRGCEGMLFLIVFRLWC
jgi:hypothetical protein